MSDYRMGICHLIDEAKALAEFVMVINRNVISDDRSKLNDWGTKVLNRLESLERAVFVLRSNGSSHYTDLPSHLKD